MLSTGQIYCGHVAGRWVSDSLGSNSLYPGRCQLFASSSTITLVGHLTGGGWSANNGPYSTYLLTTDPCTTNVEDLCAPEKEDLCTASGTSMSDAQATCSAYSGNTNMYDECITDVCASGAIPPPGSPSPPDHIVDGDDINNGIRGTLPPVPPLLPPGTAAVATATIAAAIKYATASLAIPAASLAITSASVAITAPAVASALTTPALAAALAASLTTASLATIKDNATPKGRVHLALR